MGNVSDVARGGSRGDLPRYGLRFELEGNNRCDRTSDGHANNTISSDGGRGQKYGPRVNAPFNLDIGIPYVVPWFGAPRTHLVFFG